MTKGWFGRFDLPGLAPALRALALCLDSAGRGALAEPAKRVDLLGFASPKKSKQKKGDPGCSRPSASLRATCGARSRRGSNHYTALRSNNAFALIRLTLRSSAHPDASGRGQKTNTRTTEDNKDSPWRVLVSSGIRLFGFAFVPAPDCPVVDAPRSAESGGSGHQRCLSRRRVVLDPAWTRAPQVARSEAEGRSNAGSPFLC